MRSSLGIRTYTSRIKEGPTEVLSAIRYSQKWFVRSAYCPTFLADVQLTDDRQR